MARKKKGYNWKARQTSRIEKFHGQENDTNELVLLPKERNNEDEDDTFGEIKSKPKLNSKQRKRLKKVLEVKEQKAKHRAIIQNLQKFVLPKEEMNMLVSSTALSRKRITRKELDANVSLSALPKKLLCRRRKCRKRTGIPRAKKVPDPQKPDTEEETISESESETDQSEDEDLYYHEKSPNDSGRSINNACGRGNNNETNKKTDDTYNDITRSNDIKRQIQYSVVPVMKPITDHVLVYRAKAIQVSRLELPILSEEHTIMEAVYENDIVILSGDTGSGKTTQVPQFLYEGGYAHQQNKDIQRLIGITEPRRIATMTMSKRVAEEMVLSDKIVSYQIRYDGCVSEETRIKFMTDGILLKEIEKDFQLLNYSAIIIDEAHERSVFTDILIGLLSRIVPLRRKNGDPLKLIIMSATLRVDDFVGNTTLFPTPPPLVTIDSRQFPVSVHFNRETPPSYLEAAYKKICRIHRELPEGHILVFLTGKSEILSLCSRLRKTFAGKTTRKNIARKQEGGKKEISSDDTGDEESVSSWIKKTKRKKRVNSQQCTMKRQKEKRSEIDLDSYPIVPAPLLPDGNALDGQPDTEGDYDFGYNSETGSTHKCEADQPLVVLPLYSMLSSDRQSEVFAKHTDGIRRCIISTNVAETSVTIPDVKYVVDTGKVKKKHYDRVTGASTFRIEWISKASANQRSGRAGRTAPGHCYRLYSSSVYQHQFAEHTPPDITNRPVSDLVLHMKVMNIHKVINFPFPTPPSKQALKSAEDLLVHLGALDRDTLEATPLGHTLSNFPIAPRYSKMLCLSNQKGCLPYMVTIVSALSVPELFVSEETERCGYFRRSWAGQGEYLMLGDLMVLLRAVCAYECSNDRELFCKQYGLRGNGIHEVQKLRQQLTNIINTVCSDVDCYIDPNLAPPTQHQAEMLRQMVLLGHSDHVARKICTNDMNAEDKKKFRYAYETPSSVEPVYIHPSSVLRSTCPLYVMYQELIETDRLYMRGISSVEEEWFPMILPELCTFSAPFDTPPPRYDSNADIIVCHMTSTFGLWSIPSMELPFPDTVDRYKYFAKFLLEGEVIGELGQFTDSLLAPSVTLIKPWGRLHKRTEVLLSSLVAKKVSSKQSLMNVWSNDDPKFLLAAYSMWLPEAKHGNLLTIWPPLK